MNNIEEILWNYIDGNCTTDEQEAISKLIAQDESYRLKYNELVKLNEEFMAIELDEPPMAFTDNVMEDIRAEYAKKPLKSAINKKIITMISIFFVLTISVLLVITLSNISFSSAGSSINVPSNFKVPDMNSFISRPVKLGLVFFDVVLALFLFDNYLRSKRNVKHI